jgi:TonB family protein
MRRIDVSGTAAFCASLVVHALVIVSMSWAYAREMERQGRSTGRADVMQRAQAQERIAVRDGGFGEAAGKGEAINSLDFTELFKGRPGPQDQAPLSLDPVGAGALDDGSVPSALTEVVVVEIPESIDTSKQEAAPFGVGMIAEVMPKMVARPPMPMPVKAALAQASEGTGPAGDPSPQSESESDPFSRGGTVEVRNGRVDARLGREFKSVKPRLSLKAQLDAMSVQRPVVEMKVSIDETGKVIDVKILRSSGSNEIDVPTTTAMYKWWIEPARDKEGRAVKDVILVTFSYL